MSRYARAACAPRAYNIMSGVAGRSAIEERFSALSAMKLFFLIALVPLVLGDPIDVSSYPFSATLATDDSTGEPLYQLYWNFDKAAETITFSVRVKTTGWVGFGLSPNGGMVGSDVVIGWVADGQNFFNDRYADAQAVPPIDESQDWFLLEGEEDNGYTSLTFTKKWVTCDDRDRDVASDTSRVVFSWNPVDPSSPETPSYHGTDRRGTLSLNLLGGLNDPPELPDDVATFTIAVDNVAIPDDRDTLYHCTGFKLPEAILNQKRYIVQFSPAISEGSLPYVHHMLFYQCPFLNETTDIGPGGDCDTEEVSQNIQNCRLGNPIIAAWAVGAGAFTYPEGVAFPIGGANEVYQFIVIEVHYNNPAFDANKVDSSGVEFFYTSTAPTREAGVLNIGHTVTPLMVIPPKAEEFIIYGKCPSNCTQTYFPPGGINVFASFLHTHLVGAGLTLQHFRPNSTCAGGYEELKPIDENLMYDFNYQQTVHLPQEVNVLPGDILVLKCYYDTKESTGVTLGGESTREEMCLSFLTYYPRTDIGACASNTAFESYTPFLTKYYADFSPEGQQALFTRNFSILGDTPQEQLSTLFNELEWTPEQISDFQSGNTNGTLESVCTTGEEEPTISEDDKLPENTCPYVAEDPCRATSTDTPTDGTDTPGSALTVTAVNGLVVLALATLYILIP